MILALALAALGVAGLVRAHQRGGTPADQPTPTPSAGISSGLGGWIVYGSPSGAQTVNGGTNWIWAVDPERPGMLPRRLSTQYGEPLAWSSDGSKLLVRRSTPGTRLHEPTTSLYVLNADGTLTLVVSYPDPHPLFSGESLSPDGSKVVYDSHYHIFVVDASGGTPRRIGPPGLEGHDPAFSPDGSKIAYFRGGDSDNTLNVMNADGSGSHLVLRAGMMKNGSVGNLAWFPDGRRLLFAGRICPCGAPGKPPWIYAVNADGSGLTRLGKSLEPFFLSPDGSRIASVADFFQAGLVIVKVDGTHIQHFPNALSPGPWNPLPHEPSGTASASVPLGATHADWITYSIAALIALGLAVFWFRRKRTAIPAKETVE